MMSNSQAPLLFLHSLPLPLMSYQELELARSRIDPHKQRITQTNMVYMIGIPEWLADEQILESYEYCGQYGEIVKTMVKKTYFNEHASYSAYVTFATDEAACLAVLGINNLMFDRMRVYASYGTNKYCAQFVKFGKCRKEEQCPFIHEIAVHKEIYEDDNKRIFQVQQNLAQSYFVSNYQNMVFNQDEKCVFPTASAILESFISAGLLPETRKGSDDCERNEPTSRSIERKCSTSTMSSPQKQSEMDEDLTLIQEKILLKLSTTKSSLFRFVEKEEEEEHKRIGDMLREEIQSGMSW